MIPAGERGIQADIKTMLANGVYAMSAVTALTAQNTRGVTGNHGSDAGISGRAAGQYFYRHPAGRGKDRHGVLASPLIRVIAGKLKEYQAENIVVDPVMVATSGAKADQR